MAMQDTFTVELTGIERSMVAQAVNEMRESFIHYATEPNSEQLYASDIAVCDSILAKMGDAR